MEGAAGTSRQVGDRRVHDDVHTVLGCESVRMVCVHVCVGGGGWEYYGLCVLC